MDILIILIMIILFIAIMVSIIFALVNFFEGNVYNGITCTAIALIAAGTFIVAGSLFEPEPNSNNDNNTNTTSYCMCCHQEV